MGFWAVAAPVIGSIAGGLLGKKGADKQAAAAREANQMSEAARKESRAELTNYKIWEAGDFMFPGLLPRSPSGAPSSQALKGPATQIKGVPGQGPPPLIEGRAAGGGVQEGTPYVVGEQGPEVMVPQQSGTVMPNPGSPGAGGAAPTPAWGIAGSRGATRQPGLPRPAPAPAAPTPAPAPAPGAPAAPAPGGATVAPPQTAQGAFTNPGEAATAWNLNMFNNPGQLSSIAYERAQEQSNQGLNAAVQGSVGNLAAAGIDPSSPMALALQGSAAATAGRQRNEAARDYTLAQEALKRQDLATAFGQYLQMLQSSLGLAQSRAEATSGKGFTPVQISNPYGGLASGLAQLGYGLGQYYQNKAPQGGGGGDTGGSPYSQSGVF